MEVIKELKESIRQDRTVDLNLCDRGSQTDRPMYWVALCTTNLQSTNQRRCDKRHFHSVLSSIAQWLQVVWESSISDILFSVEAGQNILTLYFLDENSSSTAETNKNKNGFPCCPTLNREMFPVFVFKRCAVKLVSAVKSSATEESSNNQLAATDTLYCLLFAKKRQKYSDIFKLRTFLGTLYLCE